MGKIILGILILGGAAYFAFFAGNKNEVDTSNESETSEVNQSDEIQQTENFEEKTTLAKLMENGGNYECTFSHSTEIGESTGTVYISGKKIRGDFISKVTMAGVPNIGDIKTFMISDGESVYTWSSMSAEGYKVPQAEQDKTSQSDASVPTNQELDYKCTAWQVDNSKFSLPTSITFKTL